MQCWNYIEVSRKKEDVPLLHHLTEFDKKMTEIGSKGWECYSITNGIEGTKIYHFKKPYEAPEVFER